MEYLDLLGKPFKIHGRSKEEGFDCYGLVIEVLKRNGITVPDVFYDESLFDERTPIAVELHSVLPVVKIEKAEKNCIIEIAVNGLPKHIAVYIGDGKMIHSVYHSGVVIEPLRRYEKRVMGYYKVKNQCL